MSEFKFGKKDEKLYKNIINIFLKIDIDVNKRNNLLNRMRIALRKSRKD